MPEGSVTQVVTSSDGQSSKTYAQIIGAEIMRVGTWNGTKFTPQDLEDIASAAAEMGYVPPLKIGHDESIGARAWGWIRNLRLAGEKLIGDLMDIPESLAAIIRERGYDQLSAEVYLDLDRNGKKFRRALKAVALLGGEVPAVSGLKPLRELFQDTLGTWRVQGCEMHGYVADAICFTNQHDGGRKMPATNPEDTRNPAASDPEIVKLREQHAAMTAKAEAQAAQLAEQKAAADAQAAELATLKQTSEAQAAELATQREQTLALEAKNREIALTAKLNEWKGPPAFRPFLEALYRTSSESPRTLKFSAEPGKSEDMSLEGVVDKMAEFIVTKSSWMLGQLAVVGGTDHYEDAGAEVDARVKKLISATPALGYQEAVVQVLNADPELKSAYAGPSTSRRA